MRQGSSRALSGVILLHSDIGRCSQRLSIIIVWLYRYSRPLRCLKLSSLGSHLIHFLRHKRFTLTILNQLIICCLVKVFSRWLWQFQGGILHKSTYAANSRWTLNPDTIVLDWSYLSGVCCAFKWSLDWSLCESRTGQLLKRCLLIIV